MPAKDRTLEAPIKGKMPGWPNVWTAEALQEQLALLRPRAFERGFRQKPQTDSDLIFPSFAEGKNYEYEINWRNISDPDHQDYAPDHDYYVDPDWPRYLGCDLAGKKRKGNVLFTLAISPSGVRHVLDIRLGAWSGPEMIRQIEAINDNRLLRPRRIFVENNAYQEALVDFIKDFSGSCSGKVQGFRTGSNKMDVEIGLPSIDIQYSTYRWRIGVPHSRSRPSHPDPKDPTMCQCGLCLLIWHTHHFTRDDLDVTPDVIAAQFIAKEASRQGERFSDTSISVVKVTQNHIQEALKAGRAAQPNNSLRLPVTYERKKYWGNNKPRTGDYGRKTY